ncbi:hypothetical protein EJ357_47145 [Streptomyces cyaneochromogenes]|uniref:Uncharacterized protein n=1 Tax=Streptomyces cyaneochromogenes TaxID=2496836 RepID=A0A3S9MLI6_9ACTN|nr:hypothetical protein [Streptomyces cyaneochromogenes]AZQ40036.1 hypothetical protein EJ357_47145 [Streptomyces cyaneochromogenes]
MATDDVATTLGAAREWTAPAPPATGLPKLHQLSMKQQIAICCARCAQYLGASGRQWGDLHHRVHDRTFVFKLWVCESGCRPFQGGPA